MEYPSFFAAQGDLHDPGRDFTLISLPNIPSYAVSSCYDRAHAYL